VDVELYAQISVLLEADVHIIWAAELTVCNVIQSYLAVLNPHENAQIAYTIFG
jgi:hypothetical protein